MENSLVVGMKLYAEKKDRNAPAEIREYTISKIGRKYFEVEENTRYKFSIENLTYEDKLYSQHNVRLYRSKEEIELIKEQQNLLSKIREYFSWHNSIELNVYELREIAEIIGIKTEKL